ncbi:alpha/beta fold hydrolase [Adhaeribacter pallidiroseus]|uniref:3-hydroxyisobutyryl-CoA hydrolase n=1 Tax=Adhaeribacter pallidiroseus TaxID=2072847 RepID=A0A369QKW2_9BACT|nr:alpha/beta hydrolase [Adhaeribacter pallidiroseus]RDC65022.1 3-hydroxyisobutyryl-CoA hydrolase [Adhaeribacter pallidiroseus]
MIDVSKRNNVRVIGEGNQSIILAHGFGCSQNVWRHFVTAYKDKFKLILFDFVGAGQSDLSAYDSKRYSTLDGYAKDVLEIIEALHLKNTIFIGHSVSCMVGVKAAILQPTYFSKLIFVSPSPYYINDQDYKGGLEKEDLINLLALMDSNYLGWSSFIAPQVMGNPNQPELGEELTANFCATDPDIAKEFARVTFLSDNRADLEKLPIQSLTLQCQDDILAPLEVGYFIEQKAKDNTLKILKATGHCPHLSAPEETIAVINAYLHLPE